jgi:hypothetical protein
MGKRRDIDQRNKKSRLRDTQREWMGASQEQRDKFKVIEELQCKNHKVGASGADEPESRGHSCLHRSMFYMKIDNISFFGNFRIMFQILRAKKKLL